MGETGAPAVNPITQGGWTCELHKDRSSLSQNPTVRHFNLSSLKLRRSHVLAGVFYEWVVGQSEV